MIPYWLMFGIVATGALQFGTSGGNRERSRAMLTLVAMGIALLIGLRFQVGGDWAPYQETYDRISLLNLANALTQSDRGYAFLNWVAAQLGTGIWFVNLACALMVMAGIARLSLQQPNPFLALLVSVPYFVIVVAMGYTRQAAAIGLLCLAITTSGPNRLLKATGWIILGTLMHKTAILALPIMLFPMLRRNVMAATLGVAFFCIAFYFALRDSTDALVANYIEGSYDSSGALIRVLMNVLSAGLFFVFRRRLGFDAFQLNYWTICSALAVISMIALAVAPSSSGIDRLSLFLIPLQVVVLSRMPYVEYGARRMNREILAAVIAYCALVQAVWLFAGEHARLWVPYRIIVEEWTESG